MVMKDYDYFKAEEKLINSVYTYEAIIKLKEGLISLLEMNDGAEAVKLKKRYAKEVQKNGELLDSAKAELTALHDAQFGGEEEKKEPLPDYILEMSDRTISDIENFNSHNETLIKVGVQIKELEKEIAKIGKLTPEQLEEVESFMKKLGIVKDGLVEEFAKLEQLVQELDTKTLRGVGKLIYAIDSHQKGRPQPKQMQ